MAMSEWEDEPELAGYQPGSGRPMRSRRLLFTLRAVVVVGILCLVLPQVITTATVAASTADTTCAAWVRYEAPDAAGASARFELFGAGGPGWECYAVGAFAGDDRNVASLGLIPVSPKLSRVPTP